MDDLKINYTSGAKKELETLIDDIKKRIEDSCVKDKQNILLHFGNYIFNKF